MKRSCGKKHSLCEPMSDQRYMRLDPERMGFRFLGAVAHDVQLVLTRAFEILKDHMGPVWNAQIRKKEIFWLNVWQDDKDGKETPIPDPEIARTVDAWARSAAKGYCEHGALIDGYGFVINPKGSKPQAWHVDYTTDSAALWIPLTRFTENNATQFIKLPANTPEDVLERIASDVDSVDVDAMAECIDHYVVEQIAAKPMSVLYMERGTIHRGVANTGPDHRIAFYVSVHFIKDYDNYPYYRDTDSEAGIAFFDSSRS